MIQSLKHRHAEAFALMKYRSDDGTEEELIWNSRDGVTPFIITLRSGKQATHVEWNNDEYLPDYQPKPGERIFIDLTEERAKEVALANAKRFWDHDTHPAKDDGRWATAEEMAADLAQEYLAQPGAPDLIVVAG